MACLQCLPATSRHSPASGPALTRLPLILHLSDQLPDVLVLIRRRLRRTVLENLYAKLNALSADVHSRSEDKAVADPLLRLATERATRFVSRHQRQCRHHYPACRASTGRSRRRTGPPGPAPRTSTPTGTTHLPSSTSSPRPRAARSRSAAARVESRATWSSAATESPRATRRSSF